MTPRRARKKAGTSPKAGRGISAAPNFGRETARRASPRSRAGQVLHQLVRQRHHPPQFDAAAFASLTAADFSANDQLAKMIGEPDFASLVHQGEKESMFLADVAKRVILVVLFDQRTTLGLVKLKGKGAVEHLNKVFEEMFNRVSSRPSAPQKGLLEGADDEIDKLFG